MPSGDEALVLRRGVGTDCVSSALRLLICHQQSNENLQPVCN